MSDDEQPIELWNIEGKLTPVRIGPRIINDARLDRLARQQAEAEAAELRAQLDQQAEPLIKQAIDRYERLHKLDRKVTLKQICAELGVNYGSARVLKSRYAKQKRKRKKS